VGVVGGGGVEPGISGSVVGSGGVTGAPKGSGGVPTGPVGEAGSVPIGSGAGGIPPPISPPVVGAPLGGGVVPIPPGVAEGTPIPLFVSSVGADDGVAPPGVAFASYILSPLLFIAFRPTFIFNILLY